MTEESVWQRALGDDIDRLSPGLRAYFALPPAGTVGRGTGVYEVAGSSRRWLRPVLAVLAWRRILFPEFGRGIPFTVTNTPAGDALRGWRTFDFPGRTRVMQDEMRIVGGALHDFLGRHSELEAQLELEVVEGALHLRTGRLWLNLGRLRVALPRLARIRLIEQSVENGQRVSAVLSSPVLGDWFEYTGDFRYEYVSNSDRL
ncbi:DUF4166 domain-containing protein [Glaciihabitans arcticus]|uniref:DUF4166 domain-containing protein n=1 Tax=Glaciihabitans arcticus TaxID=2668039 RepID=A0A4Q9GWZ6_9MICO|nr:DUF4166 domain-containing protein [Glaciihabitans arcticus]TBN57757.1 DUF4166 domain-containing protein [Glaciihabitans arcticus]